MKRMGYSAYKTRCGKVFDSYVLAYEHEQACKKCRGGG
jgi:hypothetical protein